MAASLSSGGQSADRQTLALPLTALRTDEQPRWASSLLLREVGNLPYEVGVLPQSLPGTR